VNGLHLGIDVGTQGVRALLVDEAGAVVARSARPLIVPAPGPEQEQAPSDWWDALCAAVVGLGSARAGVGSLAISCTSGSVCEVDALGRALGPGLLYADRRAVTAPGRDASWAVAKIAWLERERPSGAAGPTGFTSPGGFLASALLGRPAGIDVTQALKFGFDPAAGEWRDPPVDPGRLPQVVETGAVLGPVGRSVAADLGLPASAVVVAGATDGVAAQLACRPAPDRWAVSIGSTIVWKAVATERIDAPGLGVYSHRGPGDWWFPGAASSAGARVLASWATPEELTALDRTVTVTPESEVAYPGDGVGERFPFVDPAFRPWAPPAPDGPVRYAAEVLGVALVERWGIEVLVGAGCAAPGVIVTTGGATAAAGWMRLRAEVLGVPVEVPAEPSAAYGAAVIAASPHHGGTIAASAAMVRTADRIDPGPGRGAEWLDVSERFRARCSGGFAGAA